MTRRTFIITKPNIFPTESDSELKSKTYKELTTEKEYTYYESKRREYYSFRSARHYRTAILLKTAEKRNDLEQVYFDSETGNYYFAIKYTPNEEIFYYSKHDPENYDFVKSGQDFASIEEIKELAGSVYTKDYLSGLYDVLFVGILVEESDVPLMEAKYMVYTDNQGISWFMQRNDINPRVTEKRLYNLDSAKIVRPSKKDLVNIEIETWLESKPESVTTVRLTLVKQDGMWSLDNATY